MPKITDSPTFCSVPWTSLNIDQTGLVMPCQMTDYKLGNLREKTIQEILADAPLRELKDAMVDGRWHPACSWCRLKEQTSGQSPRTKRLVEPEVKQQIDLNVDYFHLRDLAVNWSNLCNLTCVYCNDHTSTAWQGIKGIPITYIRNEQRDLVELAAAQGQNIRGLTLGGGEPLLQKSLPDFLDRLNPEICWVTVTTNLSVDISTNPVYQQLKDWPQVTWMISFDNVDPHRFEYVRRGASWSVFYENLQLLRQGSQYIWAHPAYSIYCALDLQSYYQFCDQQGIDLFWCELTHPWDLDVRRTSAEFRRRAQEEIDSVIEKYPNKFSQETLTGYRHTLIDPSHLIQPDYQINTLEWHRAIEQQLSQIYTFEELWPLEASLLA